MNCELHIIGFDGKRAAQNRTGLGNYSRGLIRGLVHEGLAARLLLYVPSLRRATALDGLEGEAGVELRSPEGRLWRWFKGLWRMWGMTRQLQADGVELFHGLSGELPFNIGHARGIRSVVTVHDLIFLRHPAYYKPIDRWLYRLKFSRACRVADHIIAVSQCTKRDIIHFFGTPAEKIDVIYQSCDERFRQPASQAEKDEVRRRYGLPERYILSVGSIEERKNLLLLAQALELTADREVEVVAVGRPTRYAGRVEQFVRQHGLAQRFHILHDVPSAHLPALYQMATVFVYPSRYEGFGIPLLEALCSGTPAIGCTGSCLEEAGGPDSLYVDPDDAPALARALDRLLADPQLCRQMADRGRLWAERFRPDRLAQQLVELYGSLAPSFS